MLEVAAAKAHIAPLGRTRERFEIAESKANASSKLATEVTWKAIQDRYKRLQSRFDRNERVEAAMTGVGGEYGEMEELLNTMREARQDLNDATREKKNRCDSVMQKKSD